MGYKDPEKQREYQRLWIARRRNKWFEKNGPCLKCSSWEQLELDHINEKENHRIWSWSQKRRDEELAKCQVLCRKCHQEKTTLYCSEMYGSKRRNQPISNLINNL